MLQAIRVVLSRPLYSGNIGSVARVMANMGLSDLVLVQSEIEEPAEARKMACNARAILDSCRRVDNLAEAVADCVLVIGATAREGLYRQHCRTPREWAPEILSAAASGRVALVFGPEDNGLNNEEVALCTRLVRIPSSPDYRALNLSHAVLVCAYEIFVAADRFELPPEKSPEAEAGKKERMFAMWEALLLRIGFMDGEKAAHMMQGVRRIFTRGRLTDDDVRILMGIARQMQWYAEKVESYGDVKIERAAGAEGTCAGSES
ncbi:MAG: RNA methyltransferase [Kiritimatiellia bacterium]